MPQRFYMYIVHKTALCKYLSIPFQYKNFAAICVSGTGCYNGPGVIPNVFYKQLSK